MASIESLPAVLSPALTDREAVADALHRCTLAWDTNDAALFDSAWTPEGVLKLGKRPIEGLPAIHATGNAIIFSLDTTHLVGNVRVSVEGAKASLTATLFAQHFAAGKGMEMGQPMLMGGDLCRGELVKDADGLWKFTLLAINANWVEGDWAVVGGNFPEMEH